jgi:RNA polymerase sigma-70 factor, ECF subfamily
MTPVASNFNQIALGHLDALYGYAMALTRDQNEAEDLVQDTYLRAATAVGQLASDRNLKSWLFVIMRNAWLNQLRHRRSGPRFVELDSAERNVFELADATAPDPQAMYFSKLERKEVRTAIENLPAIYREIVVLRDIEGFSYQEIATLLRCPAGTVMSRLARARERLRQSLSKRQMARAKAV